MKPDAGGEETAEASAPTPGEFAEEDDMLAEGLA